MGGGQAPNVVCSSPGKKAERVLAGEGGEASSEQVVPSTVFTQQTASLRGQGTRQG